MCRPSSHHRLEPRRAPRRWSRAGPGRGSTVTALAGRLPVLVEHRRRRPGRSRGRTGPRPTPAAASRCDRAPNASSRSRVMPRRCAIRSAAVNWSGRSRSQSSGPGLARGSTLLPSGARLIASTPQAMPTSITPDRDEAGDQVHGLLRGSALRVDRGHARPVRQARVQPGVTPDVPALLARLRDAPGEDLIHRRRVDSRPGDEAVERRGEHRLRLHPRPASRCACRSEFARLRRSLHPWGSSRPPARNPRPEPPCLPARSPRASLQNVALVIFRLRL